MIAEPQCHPALHPQTRLKELPPIGMNPVALTARPSQQPMHISHLLASARYNPAHDEAWQAFQDAAGVEPEADDEQIDDDIAIEHAGSSLAPNERCPISGRPVRGWCWLLGHAGQAAGSGLVTSAAEWRGSHCAWCRTVRRAWPARRSTCRRGGAAQVGGSGTTSLPQYHLHAAAGATGAGGGLAGVRVRADGHPRLATPARQQRQVPWSR